MGGLGRFGFDGCLELGFDLGRVDRRGLHQCFEVVHVGVVGDLDGAQDGAVIEDCVFLVGL